MFCSFLVICDLVGRKVWVKLKTKITRSGKANNDRELQKKLKLVSSAWEGATQKPNVL